MPLLGLRPSGDWQGQVDADAAAADSLDEHLEELIAPALPIDRPALEPLRAHVDEEVETASVVRPQRTRANLDITGLEVSVVGLFRACHCYRYRVRQSPKEAEKPFLLHLRRVGDLHDRHTGTVEDAAPDRWLARVGSPMAEAED